MKLHTKICQFCGKEFQSKSKNKRFCDNVHYAKCCVCGNQFEIPKNNVGYYFDRLDRVACSAKCRHELGLRTAGLSQEERNRRIKQAFIDKYGVENPGQLKSVIDKRQKTSLNRYGTIHATQSDKAKESRKQTCLKKYGVEYITQSSEFKNKCKNSCIERYGVEYYTQTDNMYKNIKESSITNYGTNWPSQSQVVKDKIKSTNLEKYGAEHIMKTSEGINKMFKGIADRHDGNACWNNPDKRKHTCQSKYGVEYYLQSDDCKHKTKLSAQSKYGVDHHAKSSEVISKRIKTCEEKYNATNVFGSEYGKQKVKQSMIDRYGVANPSQVPEFKAKATRRSKNSKLEQRIQDLFNNYNIKFIRHYILTNESINRSHEFDFFLPDYKLLIDADGLYYHSYLSDPDGYRSNDYYDDIRISIVPKDHQFHVIVEGNEDSQVKHIVQILKYIDSNIFNYDSYLFNWCRSISFPYPKYSDDRLIKDWLSLCNYTNDRYVQQCRIGESIIKHFHPSIYHCRVGNSVSPVDAWYDDKKLKEVITNRLIYVNNVDPSKILRGFNISKICPVVSIFNPILTRYIIHKYLPDVSEIFDPFSGFSGRLLGTASWGKRYIGQDLNVDAVNESNQIIDFLKLDNCSVSHRDIFDSTGAYECLLTCPPYNKKEIYSRETVYNTCDGWIDECLDRFDCKTYVFVVDDTAKYQKYVVEDIKSTSHFSNNCEKLIIVHKQSTLYIY